MTSSKSRAMLMHCSSQPGMLKLTWRGFTPQVQLYVWNCCSHTQNTHTTTSTRTTTYYQPPRTTKPPRTTTTTTTHSPTTKENNRNNHMLKAAVTCMPHDQLGCRLCCFHFGISVSILFKAEQVSSASLMSFCKVSLLKSKGAKRVFFSEAFLTADSTTSH